MIKKIFVQLSYLCALSVISVISLANPPSSFDLRDVNGASYVTPVKAKMISC